MKGSKTQLSGCAIVIIITILLALGLLPHASRDLITGTVTEKERIVKGTGDSVTSYYLVWLETETGEQHVFKNADSFVEWKFDSSSMQGKLKVGNQYRIGVYGWRLPFFSMYKNIVTVVEL